MPQIPRLSTSSINTNAVDLAQGPSLARSTMATQAMGQLGELVAGIGADLLQKRNQAETSSYINTRKNELSRLVSEKKTELEAKYTGDPTGYASEMNEFLNSYGEEHLDSAPNSKAKEIWNQEFSSYANEVGIKSLSDENLKRVKHQRGLIDQDVYKNRQTLANKPNSALGSEFLINSFSAINDGIGAYYDETEAEELKRKTGAEYASTLLEGYENDKRYAEGIKFLEGRDPAGKPLLEYTDPKQIQAYKDRFKKLAQQEAQISTQVINSRVNDITRFMMDGNKVDPAQLNEIYSQVNSLQGEQKKVILDNLNNAAQYSKALQDVKSMSIEDIKKIATFEVPIEKGDSFNYADRKAMASMYQTAATNILNMKISDGATFAVKNDRELEALSMQATDINDIAAIKSYSTRVIEKQKLDGVSSPKVLTKDMAEKYGAMLKARNPEAAMVVMSNLKAGFGDNFGSAVSEMVERKTIEPEQAMAMYLSDNSSISKSFANISNKKVLAESWAKIGKKADINDIYTDERISDFKRTLSINDPNQSNLWIGEGVDRLMKIEYQSLRAEGIEHDEAKEQAITNILDKNISIAKSKNSSVIMTGAYKPFKSSIEDFMSDSLSKENIHKMKINIPNSYKQALQGADMDEDIVGRFNKDVADNGVWLTSKSQESARLVLKTSKGYASLNDVNGKPIEVKFSDMVKTPIAKKVSYKEGF